MYTFYPIFSAVRMSNSCRREQNVGLYPFSLSSVDLFLDYCDCYVSSCSLAWPEWGFTCAFNFNFFYGHRSWPRWLNLLIWLKTRLFFFCLLLPCFSFGKIRTDPTQCMEKQWDLMVRNGGGGTVPFGDTCAKFGSACPEKRISPSLTHSGAQATANLTLFSKTSFLFPVFLRHLDFKSLHLTSASV